MASWARVVVAALALALALALQSAPSHAGGLKVRVLNGRVKDEDTLSDSDPWVKVTVNGRLWETRKISDDNSPNWNQEHNFGAGFSTSTRISFEARDDDVFGSKGLGSSSFLVSEAKDVSTFQKACCGGFINFRVTFTPVDPCTTNNGGCGANSDCTFVSDGQRTCACQANHAGTNGMNCLPINACTTNNGGCLSHTSCVRTGANTRRCDCDTGYEPQPGSSVECQAINPCTKTPAPCGANSNCVFTAPGSHTCACKTNFWSATRTNCKAVTVCRGGSFQTVKPTGTSDRTCASCPAGKSCAGGTQAPANCGSNGFFAAAGQASCTPVTRGFYTQGGTAATRTSQAECPVGSSCTSGAKTSCRAGSTYQDATKQLSCKPCSVCRTGVTELSACTATTNTNCKDTTRPQLTVTGSGTTAILEATVETYQRLRFTCTDTADGDITQRVSVAVPSGTGVRLGDTSVVYRCADAGGNAAQVTHAVKTQDTLPPVLRLLGQQELDIEAGRAYTDAGATAKDLVDGPVTASIAVSGLAPLTARDKTITTRTITYRVMDSSGNTATPVTRIVHVDDTMNPIITLRQSSMLFVEAGKVRQVWQDPGATADDEVSGDITALIRTAGADLVDNTQLGLYLVTYDVTDGRGLAARQVVRTVTVHDTTKPVLTLAGVAPGSGLVHEAGTPYSDPTPSATDNFADDAQLTARITVTGDVVDAHAATGSTFSRVYRVTDGSGNTASRTLTVTIQDSSAPTLTLLGSPTLVLEGAVDLYVESGWRAEDVSDGNLTTTVVVESALNTRVVGTYLLNYSVTDRAGLSATASRSVVVRDTRPPVFAVPVTDSVVLLHEAAVAFTPPTAIARDLVDDSVRVTVAHSVNVFPAATPANFSVQYTARDASGNTARRNITVVVRDTTAPAITFAPVDFNLEGGTVYAHTGVSAADTLDGDLGPALTFNITEAATGKHVGAIDPFQPISTEYTVAYAVVDAAGNSARRERLVTIVDTLPPTITLLVPEDDVVNGARPPIPYTFFGAAAIDLHDGDVSGTLSAEARELQPSPSEWGPMASLNLSSPLGTVYELRLSASDYKLNVATATRQVTVVDRQPPIITLRSYSNRMAVASEERFADSTVQMELIQGSPYIEPGAVATDGYDGDVSGLLNITGPSPPLNTSDVGSTATILYNGSDRSGNSIVSQRIIAVVAAPSSSKSRGLLGKDGLLMIGPVVLGLIILVALVAVVVVVRRSKQRHLIISSATSGALPAQSYANPLFLPNDIYVNPAYESFDGGDGGDGVMRNNPAYQTTEEALIEGVASGPGGGGSGVGAVYTTAPDITVNPAYSSIKTAWGDSGATVVGERTPPFVPPRFIHGRINRRDAEALLTDAGLVAGTFLIRYRDVHAEEMTLSMCVDKVTMRHYIIKRSMEDHGQMKVQHRVIPECYSLRDALKTLKGSAAPKYIRRRLDRALLRRQDLDLKPLIVDSKYLPFFGDPSALPPAFSICTWSQEMGYQEWNGAQDLGIQLYVCTDSLPPSRAEPAGFEEHNAAGAGAGPGPTSLSPHSASGRRGSDRASRRSGLYPEVVVNLPQRMALNTEVHQGCVEPWFHGLLDEAEARRRVAESGSQPGAFLVWHEQPCPRQLRLGVCHNGAFETVEIDVTEEGLFAIPTLPTTPSLAAAIGCLRDNPDVLGLELVQPVATEQPVPLESADGFGFFPECGMAGTAGDRQLFCLSVVGRFFLPVPDTAELPEGTPRFFPAGSYVADVDDYLDMSEVFAEVHGPAAGRNAFIPVDTEGLDDLMVPTYAAGLTGQYVAMPVLAAEYVHRQCSRSAAEEILLAAASKEHRSTFLVRSKGPDTHALSILVVADGQRQRQKVVHHLLKTVGEAICLDNTQYFTGSLMVCVRELISQKYPNAKALKVGLAA